MKMTKNRFSFGKKTVLAVALALFVLPSLYLANHAGSKIRAYYSGKAIVYNDRLYIGSTNMGAFELFRLEDGFLSKVVKLESFEAKYGGWDPFYDLEFSREDSQLYVYLVDGRFLYKYSLSDPAHPALVSKVKDNSYDWLLGVKKFDDRIVTVGTKGVKVWRPELQTIDTFPLKNDFVYNLNFNDTGEFIFNVGSSSVEIFDTKTRLVRSTVPITVREQHNRKTLADDQSGRIYIVDDKELRQFDYEGQVQHTFRHISRFGYEVAGVPESNYVYFSDGIGIVKIDKASFEPVDWRFTNVLGAPGGWAMGLQAVRSSQGEKIVVFNNSSILVFDEHLRLLGSYDAYGEDINPVEPLGLSADKFRAPANAEVSLRGTGFGLDEDLLISFADAKFEARADETGKFTQIMTVPAISPTAPRWVDIRVEGKTSKRHYSMSFYIE